MLNRDGAFWWKNKEKAFSFLNKLKLVDISNNLGDSKSLITHPYTTTHHRLSEKEKISLRITENLVRLSVGLEDFEDIVNDFEDGFRAAKKPRLVANK